MPPIINNNPIFQDFRVADILLRNLFEDRNPPAISGSCAYMQVILTMPSSMSRQRCASVRASALARRWSLSVLPISSSGGSTRQCQNCFQENPGSPAIYRILAACYGHMGLVPEARNAVEKLRAITSQVMPSALPWRVPEHRELLLSGLHVATGASRDQQGSL
jgi:hypothetical protein